MWPINLGQAPHGWSSSKTSYKTEEALFAAIGFGEIGAITVFNRLTEKERREEERAKAKAEAEELVKGGEVKVENKETLKG